MASRIVMYRLEAKTGPRQLALPAGSEPLAASYYNGAVALWVVVPDMDGQPKIEPKTLEIVGTGDTLDGNLRYLGTCAAPGGTFCVHVLERRGAAGEPEGDPS